MIGNILALTNSTSNENIEVDGLLKKGLYNGNASDLKSEIDKKVSQEAGKVLSSNDFTNELRQKLEGLQQVDTSGLLPKGGYTGTAQDLKNLIDAINRILQSDDTDLDQLQEIVEYIKQNKHILSTLGISNIAGLVEALAAKAEKDHHHDDRYAPKTHHHNEYALRTHRHNWDDIDGKPNNLATTESVKTAVEGIKIGGRNYIVGSNVVINSAYNQTMRMSNELIAILNSVRLVTVSVYIEYSKLIALGNRRLGYEFVITYTDNSKHYVHAWKPVSEADLGGSYAGRFSLTHALHNGKTIQSITSTGLHIQCTAENVKLGLPKVEIGNKPTDWSPAPEDLYGYWTREKGSPYGDCIMSLFPIIIKEAYFDNQGSKVNLWTANNELNVGSRNIGGHSRINCNGYKIQDKDNNYVLLAGGDSVHKNILLGRKGYVSDGGTLNQQDHSNSTVFVRSSGNFELSPLENLTSCSFIKVFDGGNITFSCSGKTVITRGDTQLNGAKGSTAVVSIYENECYIRISNV